MKIIPISKENHGDWSYVGLTNYMHTKNDAIVPILIAEIDRITIIPSFLLKIMKS